MHLHKIIENAQMIYNIKTFSTKNESLVQLHFKFECVQSLIVKKKKNQPEFKKRPRNCKR